MKVNTLRQIIREEISKVLNENTSNPRSELHSILKELVIASSSTAYNAAEREKAAEKKLDEFLKRHPEITDEEVEDLTDRIIAKLP